MFFLLGPTAVGKSELAVEIALRCNAEILGADAFQVYRGLNILTAKPSADLLSRVPHHLIGEISPSAKFDVARYRDLATRRIAEIDSRGKRVLVVGGTGLYIRALTHGLSDLPESDPELRRELEVLSLPELQEKYAALDSVGIERIDRQNPRRLIRAIEVTLLAATPFSALRSDWSGTPEATSYRAVILQRDRDDLYQRIDARVLQMVDQGVLDEMRDSPPLGPTASQAIGYTTILKHLRGEITRRSCIEEMQRATRRYAKRQLTWLRRENIFDVVNLTNTPQTKAADFIVQWITSGAGEKGVGDLRNRA